MAVWGPARDRAGRISEELCLASGRGDEANRPLQYWYDEPLEFPGEGLRTALGQLQGIRNFAEPWEVKKKLEIYLAANEPPQEALERNVKGV